MTFEDRIIELEHSKIRMNIFNINIDLYWSVKSLLGKYMEGKGDNYGDLCYKLDKTNSCLNLLKKVSFNLKLIDAKQHILAKATGFSFEVTKFTKEELDLVRQQ